ncbi:class I SAM-dependent methyltransferase [Blastococcus sp. SYSU DS0619]
MDTYTHGHAEPVLQSHRWRTAENSAAYLLPSLRPGLDLLDVGCGPGTITVDLAARVAPGRVLGLDLSPDPLDEARANAERTGVAATFAVGDVYALDLPDDSFDVVHAHQVLQHLTDPVAALREMARVCRPGGVIAVRDVDYAATTWFPADDGLERWLALYRQVARRNDAEPDAGRRTPAARLGARGRAPGHDGVRRHLLLRLGRGAAVVGPVVGRPGDGVGLRRAGGRLRAGHARGARGHRRRLVALGGRRRRLAGHAARRAARPRAVSGVR